jgi:hypothetical protein
MTQAPTLAPNHRAITALIGISDGTNSVPDQEAEDWLVTNGLIRSEDDGVIVVTPRGNAWLGMLAATPLPVQVTQWSDPRGGDAPKQSGDSELVRMLRDVLVNAVQRAPAPARPVSQADQYVRKQQPLATEGVVDRLPGFRDNEFTTLPPGQTPPTMQRDDRVVVQRRSGKVDGERAVLLAGSVIWKWGDEPHGDDVLFYRTLPRDDGISGQ